LFSPPDKRTGISKEHSEPPILLGINCILGREGKMAKQVNCDCGFMVRTQSDDELVQHVQLHARDIHQMEVPREKALEMARPVEATVTI
jgi:predicted small metal-binding protein